MRGPVWGYVRISEPEVRKGQNPRRQVQILEEWCAREGVPLRGVSTDDGESASLTDPFERSGFLEAIAKAKENGCVAIVVEMVDRFTRQGSDEYGYGRVVLRKEHRLHLWLADQGLDAQLVGDVGSRMTGAVKAVMAEEAMIDHGRRVSSGMRTKGRYGGRPPKLSAEEKALACQLYTENGWGVRRIAHHISEKRGAFRVADQNSAKARDLRVGATIVWEALRDAGLKGGAAQGANGAAERSET